MNDYLLLLLIGIFGSIHCVGFCGPILVTLNIRAARNDIRSRLIFTLQYNAGRILTYSILGGLAGIIGGGIIHSASFAWLQGGVAFIAGAFMVYVGLALLHILPGGKLLEGEAILNLPYIKGFFGLLSGMAKFGGFFEGMLMGLIPCGMVYAVLMKAIAAGNPLEGWLLMSSFGLGTMVAMILIGLINKEILNRRILNIAYLLIVLIGMVTIIRGISPMPHHLDLEPSAQGPLSLVSWAFRHIFSPENLMMILYGLGLLLGSLGIYLFGRELGVRLKMRHKRYLWINEDLCEGCKDCIEKSGCLNLRHVETEYGRKARIHYPYCRQSYACLAGECPSFLVIDLPPGRAPKPKRYKIPFFLGMLLGPPQKVYTNGRYNTDLHSTGYQGGMKKAEAKKFLNLDLNLNLPFPGSRMKANPYKILIAGVDSVAVAQVSGLLNMAATMEGRLGYTPGAYALSGEGETVI
ncbi:MAG: sulfite exporter TauE/SafE family protein, partial [Deltaproteobacteria bacterium]|nr:sulfite exporter TauE/SafE family protein [Deltaproteobacteria bacterium]